MSKKTFITEVERLFTENSVDAAAIEYLEKMKAPAPKRVNTKAVERAELFRDSIIAALEVIGKPADRSEIALAIEGNGVTGVTAQAVTSYATQLVAAGTLVKTVERLGKKGTRTVYNLA